MEFLYVLATIPPDWLTEWLFLATPLLSIGAIIISAMRKWLVNPILENMHAHSERHSIVERELAVNGAESLLPLEERNLPLRTLMIKNRVDFLDHIEQIEPLRAQYERDLADRVSMARG